MGAISDGSFLKYTTNSDGTKVDIAKQNRLNGVSGHTLGGLIAVSASQYLPQILSGISNKFSSDDDSENLTSDELRSKINNILAKYGANNTSDIEAKLKVAQDYETKIQDYKSKYAELETVTKNISALNTELKALNEQYTAAIASNTEGSNNVTISGLAGKIGEKQKELNTALEQQAKLKKEADDIKAEVEKLSEEITSLDSIKSISEDLADLKSYEKLLKQAEGKESIKKLKNTETEEIVKIVNKLKAAKTNGNNKKTAEYETKLKEAGQEYYKKHNVGDNKTLDTLLKLYITK